MNFAKSITICFCFVHSLDKFLRYTMGVRTTEAPLAVIPTNRFHLSLFFISPSLLFFGQIPVSRKTGGNLFV